RPCGRAWCRSGPAAGRPKRALRGPRRAADGARTCVATRWPCLSSEKRPHSFRIEPPCGAALQLFRELGARGGLQRGSRDEAQLPHCTAVYSERFPDGDKGGNLALIRFRSGPVNLHSFWDGLLGTGTTAGAIGKAVQEIEGVLEARGADVRKELEAHRTFESWAREGEELSRRVVYLNGELRVRVSSEGRP